MKDIINKNENICRLLLFILYTLIISLFRNHIVIILGGVLALLLLIISRRTVETIRRSLHAFLFIALGTFFTALRGDTADSILYFVRLASIVMVSVIYISIEDPLDILDALCRVFRIREEYALSIIIALEIIPLIYNEFERIRNAQKLRGLDHGRRLGAFKMIIPAFISLLNKSESIEKLLYIKCLQE